MANAIRGQNSEKNHSNPRILNDRRKVSVDHLYEIGLMSPTTSFVLEIRSHILSTSIGNHEQFSD